MALASLQKAFLSEWPYHVDSHIEWHSICRGASIKNRLSLNVALIKLVKKHKTIKNPKSIDQIGSVGEKIDRFRFLFSTVCAPPDSGVQSLLVEPGRVSSQTSPKVALLSSRKLIDPVRLDKQPRRQDDERHETRSQRPTHGSSNAPQIAAPTAIEFFRLRP